MQCQWETILTAELTPGGIKAFVERSAASSAEGATPESPPAAPASPTPDPAPDAPPRP